MKRHNATDKIVPVVLNIGEHTQLKVAAATARMTLAAYIHERLFGPGLAVPSHVVQPRPSATTEAGHFAKPESLSGPTVGCHEARAPLSHVERQVTPPAGPEEVDPFLADAFGGRPPPVPVNPDA